MVVSLHEKTVKSDPLLPWHETTVLDRTAPSRSPDGTQAIQSSVSRAKLTDSLVEKTEAHIVVGLFLVCRVC
jgi:hypothetical protein